MVLLNNISVYCYGHKAAIVVISGLCCWKFPSKALVFTVFHIFLSRAFDYIQCAVSIYVYHRHHVLPGNTKWALFQILLLFLVSGKAFNWLCIIWPIKDFKPFSLFNPLLVLANTSIWCFACLQDMLRQWG